MEFLEFYVVRSFLEDATWGILKVGHPYQGRLIVGTL